MAKLDRDLSQEVKWHQLEKKQMKYIITQLVNQKQELKDKLAKTTPSTKPFTPSIKPSASSKSMTTKLSALFSSTLKKPNTTNTKSNVKYVPVNHSKTLKSPSYIKFNQIQIEKIEIENFNTSTPRQKDIMQREISDITNLELNTPSPRPNKIPITFPTPKPLPNTVFIASESLPHAPLVDSLLIKKKHLGLSKHKINTNNTSAFTFDKPTSTNPPEFNGIEKPKV
jgi:hypothetical protein